MMANHDLILGQSHGLALGSNQQLILRGHTHHLGLPHSHDQDLVLGHHSNGLRDYHHDLHHHHHHHHSDLPGDRKPDHDLALVASCPDLAVPEREGEMDSDIDPSSEMLAVSQPQFLSSSPPVLQVRTMVVAPNYELHVGQEFPDVKSCRRTFRDTAIALHFEMQTVKSDKTRFTAKCATEGCPWRVHAAKLPGVPTFTIRTINEAHTCGGIAHLGHQQASVQWVANKVEQRLRENPNCKPKEILEEIHRIHGITLSYKQAWRGKERIMAAMRGSFEEGYRMLPQYCEQLMKANPGSIASVYGNPADDNSFQRMFISFQASIYGFLNACRPLIGLDRTLLKTKYPGLLLLATAFDGDGGMFPLAFGLVEAETEDNWMWFLSELHSLLETNADNMPRLTILSHRHKGVVDGVEANFPTAFHGFCMRHLSDIFKEEFDNQVLTGLLWEAAHALTVIEFEANILEMEEVSPEAAYWVRRIPPRLWATAYFEGARLGQLTANIAEVLHSWMADTAGLPVLQIMECIRRQLTTWFDERREAAAQWASSSSSSSSSSSCNSSPGSSLLVPTAEKRVAAAVEEGRGHRVVRASEAEFEVVSPEGSYVVDIRNRCCVCRGWQLFGLPCAHAVAALLSCQQNVQRFTESCFTVAAYRKAYSQVINPVPDKNTWCCGMLEDAGGGECRDIVGVTINPPKWAGQTARVRKKRVRAEDRGRVKRVVHCSRCNQVGHFRTTCSSPI